MFVLAGFIDTTRRLAKELMAVPEFLAVVRPLTNNEEQLPWDDFREVRVWQSGQCLCLSILAYHGVRIDLSSFRLLHGGIQEFLGDICVWSRMQYDPAKLDDIEKRVSVLKRQGSD